jgi:hypothetical protein
MVKRFLTLVEALRLFVAGAGCKLWVFDQLEG